MAQKRSLARRLVVGVSLWSLFMLVFTASILTGLNRNQARQLLQDELDAVLVSLTLAANVNEEGGLTLTPNAIPSDQRYLRPLSGRYWVIARLSDSGEIAEYLNSKSVWDWEIPWDDLLLDEVTSQLGQVKFVTKRGPDDEPLELGVKAITLPGATEPVLLIAGLDRRPTDRITRDFLITLTVAMIVLALGMIIAMVVLVRVGLRPLSRIEHDISDIRTGEKEILEGEYPREIAPLAEELNKLIEHNRNVVERARTHVGNLAHALKTPIAVLMNEAKGDEPLAALVRRQTDAMSQNVQHYLKRAQAAARAEVLGARCEVEPAINDLTRLLSRLFQDQGIRVVPGDVRPGLQFRGERQDLDEMLGNLLENACKFATAQVQASAGLSADGKLLIHVDDDGPGLTPEERAEAMKRGVRLDETAPGTGLGLSIVKDLAELYSGSLELTDSPLGGLRATLILPTVPAR